MARFLNEANNCNLQIPATHLYWSKWWWDSLTQHRPLPVIIAFFSKTRTALYQIQVRKLELNRDPWGHLDSKSIAQVEAEGDMNRKQLLWKWLQAFSWQWAQHESFGVMGSLAGFTAGVYWGEGHDGCPLPAAHQPTPWVTLSVLSVIL